MHFTVRHMIADPDTCSYDPAKGGKQTTTTVEATSMDALAITLTGKNLGSQGHGIDGKTVTVHDPNGARWDCFKLTPTDPPRKQRACTLCGTLLASRLLTLIPGEKACEQCVTEEVTQNLRQHRAAASPEHVREGTDWYPGAYVTMAEIATDAFDHTGDPITVELVAGIVAAFSQNATWKANLTMARNYCNGTGQNGMARVMAEIDAMEEGANPRDILGLKRSDFWSNMTGDLEPVTCDRWHLLASFGPARKVALTPEVHRIVTAATRMVAEEYGEHPATTQAIIWCHIRGTGA